MTTPPPIDPGVAMAWGLADASRRGPKPTLTLEEIVGTAMAIADAEGLDAVSMARVAKTLGYTTMSLYRYVASKDELLAHMQDAVLGPVPSDRPGDVDWRTGLTAWTRSALERFRHHPWFMDIPLKGPPLMPHNVEWLDWCLSHLTETPLAPLEKLSTALLLSGYAQNEVARERSLRMGRGNEQPADEDVVYEAALRHLIDPARLPALSAVLDEGTFTPPHDSRVVDGDDFMLDFGLHRILDGLERLMESRRD